MKIAIFAGPSGGHFYPALAFLEAFKKRHPEAQILFVTGERGRFLAEKAQNPTEAEFRFLPDFPFPRLSQPDFVTQMIPFLLKFTQAFLECEKILNAFEPNLSVGFGSYLAFPGMVLSRKKKIPTLAHEQNRKMGQANTLITRFADRIALSFEETEALPQSVAWTTTGLPLRSSLVEKALQKNGLRPPVSSTHRLRILVLGGSQGSQFLNQIWTRALETFSDEERAKIAVIHITGEKEFESIKAMYGSKGIEARVFPFHERMEELYSETDLVLTRAGAGTLFELALFRLPAIVVPYPYADGHQKWNARYFEKEGAIIVIPEKECEPTRLRRHLIELIHSPDLRNRYSDSLKKLAKPEASEKLVDVAEGLLAEREQEKGTERKHGARNGLYVP